MKFNWKNIRIGLLLIASMMQIYVYFTCQILTNPKIDIGDIVPVNIYIFFGLIIVSILEIFFSRKKIDEIQKINWNTTLFTMHQPIQFFNYSGWILFTAFFFPTIHSFIVESKYFLDNILLLSAGMTMMGTTYLLDSLLQKYKLKWTK
jgi:hypothetical protein